MAGIYVHIPFCKKACNYCNFFFSTSLVFKDQFLDALEKEILLQKDYLNADKIDSIYFGGGTPSILEHHEIAQILSAIYKSFSLAEQVEITLEANPDDLSEQKLRALFEMGVNRLSIGIQSFEEKDLVFMNRAHSSEEAKNCLTLASEIGFKNLSIDLIYGVPTQSEDDWKRNLSLVQEFKVNHLSCYALTVEEGTPLYHLIRKGKFANVDENLAAMHFEYLVDWAQERGWQHYEVSNLSLGLNHSKHNTSYWKNKKYLGLGPAAHSYNGESRQWNVSNIKHYIKALSEKKVPFEIEQLSEADKYNEYIMTGLRTQWGIDKKHLSEHFPNFLANFEKQVAQIDQNLISIEVDLVKLKKAGMFYADGIASQLFEV